MEFPPPGQETAEAASEALAAIVALYGAELSSARDEDRASAPMLEAALTSLAPLAETAPTQLTRHDKPVRAVLEDFVPRGPVLVQRAGAAFLKLAPLAHWRQNPNYISSPVGFLDHYGYVELVGPKAYFPLPGLRMGVLVLGPHTLYPEHSHPAEEIYHPLTSGSRWWRQGDAWRTVEAGSSIHHPPGLAHATQTSQQPLIAVYLWRGEVTTAARLADRL